MGAGGYVEVAKAVLGAAGGAVMGFLNADTANRAAKQQVAAIDRMKKYTEANMDPALVNEQARKADEERAKARLALQAVIDPELAKQREAAQKKLSAQLEGIGTSDSDKLAALAATEASASQEGMAEVKRKLIESAIQEINAGASLPPDLQAELMQAGLQRAGQVTGAASGAAGGVGSSILNQVLGSAGLQLKKERQTQAINMATAASNLDAQRQQILQGLFPKLQAQQMQNISGVSGILQQSNAMLPESGLSGADVANLWLARVGAINQLSAQKSNVAAQGALATGAAKAGAWGSIVSLGQGAAGEAAGQAAASPWGAGGGGGGGVGGGGVGGVGGNAGGGVNLASFFNSGTPSTGSSIMQIAGQGGGTAANGMAIPSSTPYSF